MKKIYVLRGRSYDKTAMYDHYYDLGFYTNKKFAKSELQRARQISPEGEYWLNEENAYGKPFKI